MTSRATRSTENLVYAPGQFLQLLNEFYAARFFTLPDEYNGDAYPTLESDGQVRIMLGGIADAGSSELIVELGEYRKAIHYISSPTYCPEYVLELEEKVQAFAWRAQGGR